MAIAKRMKINRGTTVPTLLDGELFYDQTNDLLYYGDDGTNKVAGSVVGVKRYKALLTQTGTNAPVATVLENTLGGTVVWTRTGAGVYVGTLASAFTVEKTIINRAAGVSSSGTTGYWAGDVVYEDASEYAVIGSIQCHAASVNTVQVWTRNSSGALADTILPSRYPIFIEVYP